jgi:hypothetical protein
LRTDLLESQLPQGAVPHIAITGNCFYAESDSTVFDIRLDSMLLDKKIVDGEVGIKFLSTLTRFEPKGLLYELD